jgi:Uma2 family endonuclease
MQLLAMPDGGVQPFRQLTLEEYLALPEDARAEIGDGVLRPTVRSNKRSRHVRRRLATLLEAQLPAGVRAEEEEVVVFDATPPEARIPDVVVFRASADPAGMANYTDARDVLLVVEVVSSGTQTADRYEKPGEYARNGIPSFWRIELEPDIAIHVHELVDGVYRTAEGIYRRGGLIKDPSFDWLSIEVNDLLGDYA